MNTNEIEENISKLKKSPGRKPYTITEDTIERFTFQFPSSPNIEAINKLKDISVTTKFLEKLFEKKEVAYIKSLFKKEYQATADIVPDKNQKELKDPSTAGSKSRGRKKLPEDMQQFNIVIAKNLSEKLLFLSEIYNLSMEELIEKVAEFFIKTNIQEIERKKVDKIEAHAAEIEQRYKIFIKAE